MANNRLETKILLRYATYSDFMNSDIILLPGEAAVAAFPNETPSQPPKAFGIKVGDGRRYFDELPWIQAIAADVYNWAKASTKPTYSASEISGLEQYINNIMSGSGISSYRLSWDNNTKKYILLIYNANTDSWDDTTSAVDLSSLYNRINAIERWANGEYTDIGNIEVPIYLFISEIVNPKINALDYTDSAVDHQFVTSVSETNGKIAVTRSALSANDITSGILPITRGGTGLNSISEDTVLIGTAQGLATRTYVTDLEDANNNAFATVGAIKNYIIELTAGITGAMHFIGEATVEIRNNSMTNPRILGYSIGNALPGDVILYDTKEFVWTGSNWHLLGDEGSYAIKGSIVNADIADEANIAQSKIYGLEDALDNKVDKVEGKVLSANDYTDEEKSKLSLIEDRAQVNIIEHIYLNNTELIPKTIDGISKVVDLHILEFDAVSQAKLEGIAAGAQVNIIEAISLNGVNLPPEDKRVNLIVKEFDDNSREKLAGIATGAQVNVIESIFVNNLELTPVNKRIDLTTITPDLASKLAGIAAGAQVNVIERIVINNIEMPITAATKTVELSSGLTPYVNKIENIKLNGVDLTIDLTKTVNIIAEANKVELIKMDGVLIDPTPNTKIIELLSNPAHENKIETIKLLTNNTTRDLEIINKAVTIEADVNKIEEISLNGTVLDINNKRVNIEVRGFTSAEIQKLEGIDEGAQVNTIEKIFYGTSMETADELEPDRLKRVLVPSHPEYANVIEKIIYNNEELEINNKTVTLPETSVNKIELIYYDGSRINPDAYRRVYITPEKPLIQHILINGVELEVDNKTVNLIFNQASLHLDVVEGAQIPNGAGGLAEVELISKKLLLARIAVTGDVQDLSLINDTYIILDCGSSTTVID